MKAPVPDSALIRMPDGVAVAARVATVGATESANSAAPANSPRRRPGAQASGSNARQATIDSVREVEQDLSQEQEEQDPGESFATESDDARARDSIYVAEDESFEESENPFEVTSDTES